jgi:multiple sugar transport system substrate-binding protein
MTNAVFRACFCCLGPNSLAVLRMVCGLILGLALLGCRPPATPPAATREQRPFEGQQTSMFVPAGSGFTELWDPALREWSVQTGGQVSLQEYLLEDPNSLWKSLDQSSQPAVCLIPYAWLADGLTSRDLERIPDSVLSVESGISWEDLLQGVRERIGGPRRKPQLLPLQAPVLVCYYRKDLLERAGLKVPVTWDDYSRLVERSHEWGGGLPVVEPWEESFRVTWFLSRAIAAARHPDNFSVFVDLETLQPMIDNPAFVTTLERARADMAHLPDVVWQLSPLECRQRVLEGRACLAIGIEPPGGTNSSLGSLPAQRGEGVSLGVFPLPASTVVYNPSTRSLEEGTSRGGIRLYRSNLTGWQGMVACVFQRKVAGSSIPSWNAFAQAAGPDFLNRLPPGLAGLTRESQLGDASLIIGPELTGTESAEFLAVTAEALRDNGLVLELPFPRRTEFANRLRGPLTAALRGDIPANEALSQVAQDWSALIEEIGSEPFRRAYRQMLGLTSRPFSTSSSSEPSVNTSGSR